MQYLRSDQKLTETAYMYFKGKSDNQYNTRYVEKNGGSKLLQYKVDFQFPPKITSDNKSGEWDESTSNQLISEPVAVYKGAKARTINMKWSYIVDGGGWTTKRISTIVKALRGYYARIDKAYYIPMDTQPLEVYVRIYRHIDYTWLSFRLDSIDITHSENIIIPEEVDNTVYPFVVEEAETPSPSPSDIRLEAFPLRTDITATLKPFLNGKLNVADVNTEEGPINSISRGWF